MKTIKKLLPFIASLAVLITYHEVTDHNSYEHRYIKLLELREASIKDSVTTHKWLENIKSDILEYRPK